MTLKRKRESHKDLKIVRGVFDERTLLVLYRLLNKKKISVVSSIKEGKESVILSGLTEDKQWVAMKIYCTDACNFKNMWKYLIGDPRFHNITKNRRKIVNVWCQREFKNLKIAQRANVNSPKPLFFNENILIMSFIGENGVFAPRLIDIIPDKPKQLYDLVLKNLEKLVNAGLVHGDLSAYNILLLNEPYFIDFSHATTVKSQLTSELLERDIKNINSYFSKLDITVKDPEKIYNELKQIIKEKVNK